MVRRMEEGRWLNEGKNTDGWTKSDIWKKERSWMVGRREEAVWVEERKKLNVDK